MNITDFHTHIYPEKIADKATQSICKFYDTPSSMHGTSEELLRLGREAGINRFVILPVSVKADKVKAINDFTVSEVSAHPEFEGFGTLHAEMENIADEVERIASLGLHGVKLHTDMQGFDIDDPRMFEAYEAMEGKLTLIVHSGDPRPGYDSSHPRRLRHVIDNFPHLRVIAAHLGGWSCVDIAKEYLLDTDCFVDMSSSLMYITKEESIEAIKAFGTERVLYGTDYPLWNPINEVNTFLSLPLTSSEKEVIAYKNASYILD